MRFSGLTKCVFIVVAVAVFSTGALAATQELRLRNEAEFVTNGVSGPGLAQSTLTDGGTYRNTLGLNGNVIGESRQFNFNFSGQATDDPQIDPEQATITNLQGRMSNEKMTLNLGDTPGSFSQYSLSSALKGLSYTYKAQGDTGPQLTFVYGYAYPRWDNFNPSSKTRSVRRQAYGVRHSNNYSSYFTAGLNFVRSRDSQPVNPTDLLYDTDSYGMDWEYKPLPNVSLRGESAFGKTVSSTTGAPGVTSHGSAHRFVFDGNADPTRLTFEYERVSPGFETVLGSASNDREKAKLRWRYKQSKNVTRNHSLLWFRDNLSNQKGFTTQHYKPEISWTVRRVFDRPYSSADFGVKLDRQSGGGSSTSNAFFDIAYTDRFGVFDTTTNLGYTRYDTKATTDNKEFTLNTSLGTRYTTGRWVMKPSLYLGAWRSRDELAATTDKVYEMSLGWGFDVPDSYVSSNVKIGRNKLLKGDATQDDSSKFFGTLRINYRPPYLAKTDSSLYLRASLNDYNYTTDSKDFRESTLTTGYTRVF